MNYLLDVYSDNWFNFNCTDGGNYGFKFYYENMDVRDYLSFGMQLTGEDQLTIIDNIKILPSISTDQRKAIIYNLNLEAGQSYNFNFFFKNPDQYGIDFIDTTIILSQWNSINTVKLNNDFIIQNGEESIHTYHLVAGQPYTINFTSSSNFDYILTYDNAIKSFLTKNNDMLIQDDIINTDTKNGDVFRANKSAIGQEGTIYFVDYDKLYSIKFMVVEKPYTVDLDFNNNTYELSSKFKNSYGFEVNDDIVESLRVKFKSDGKEYPIEKKSCINDLPFTEDSTEVYIIVNYAVPWYNESVYRYTETHEYKDKVATPILDISRYNQVSTNKRIILSGEPSQNKTIEIQGMVETVILTGIRSNNVYLSIAAGQNVTLILDNVHLVADTNTSIINSISSNTKIYLLGQNSIKGKITNKAYLVSAYNISFTGDGYLDIIGSNGSNGTNGTSSSVDGTAGQEGTNALICTNYEGLSSNIYITGGAGGNGGDGFSHTDANGKSGGNGGNGGNGGVGLAMGSSRLYLGYAGRGGNGGKGGDGLNGRNAYISRYYYLYNGVSHDLYQATIGGNGGNGGNAGSNGAGSTAHITEPPRGGNGGNGGKGGDGLWERAKENGNVPPPSIVIQVTITYDSPSAAGGHGGRGGDGYIGGVGGNGGNGGNGANGLDAVFLGPSGSNGGDGAQGGNGGNGGNSWADTTYAGGAGGSGAGGESGGVKGDGILTDYVDGNPGKHGLNGTQGSGKAACVTSGTLITLANGTKVAVENLTGMEMLLVWNMFTGKFESAPILFIDSEARTSYEVINLYFSDGTSVKVIGEHGFWDINLNKYVFLRNDAAKYIGHWFNKQTTDTNGNMTWTAVQLTDVVIANEITTAWSPVTAEHLCYYVNGMLSMPGGTTGLINIFDVNAETMQYDQEAMQADIEKYGMFTYEEFTELIPVPKKNI